MNNNGIQIGIADDQAKDFDFEKTEMKYDSTGMFHWSSAKSLEECILVSELTQKRFEVISLFVRYHYTNNKRVLDII